MRLAWLAASCCFALLQLLSLLLLLVVVEEREGRDGNGRQKNGKVDERLLAFPWTILEPFGCRDSPEVVVFVHSAVGNFARRDAIRRTFGGDVVKRRLGFSLFFVLGWSGRVLIEERVRAESALHRDVIQQLFTDSYANITIKALSWLRFVRDFCSSARFVVKLDDDVIFSPVSFFRILPTLQGSSIYCLVWRRQPVRRWPSSKWYLPFSVWRDDFYPDYCSGSAYVIGADLATPLVAAAERAPFYIHIDDVFITGILAAQVDARLVNRGEWWALDPSTSLRLFIKGSVIFALLPQPEEQLKAWIERRKKGI